MRALLLPRVRKGLSLASSKRSCLPDIGGETLDLILQNPTNLLQDLVADEDDDIAVSDYRSNFQRDPASQLVSGLGTS